MPYEQLASLFHKDVSSARFGTNAELAKRRLEADATYRTGFQTPAGELFVAVPHELSVLNEQVLRVERKVSLELNHLPFGAQGSLIRNLVINEVVSTNELENIHSTRRQVSDALESAELDDSSDPLKFRRFRELANLYLGLSRPETKVPTKPEDIRDVYDVVMAGEPLHKRDQPDGKWFRKGQVEIVGVGGKILHDGVYPEVKIIDGLQRMMELASLEDMPQTYSAIVSHYLFEYIHPFYDGNGRTGRYLLALYLAQPLSTLTTLSLSRAIAENKPRYYKAFKDAENPLNHGELTFFVMSMLETIRDVQSGLLERLMSSRNALDVAQHELKNVAAEQGLGEKERALFYLLAQVSLFAAFPTTTLEECGNYLGIGKQQARRYVARLEGQGLATATGRPLRVGLTDKGYRALGITRV